MIQIGGIVTASCHVTKWKAYDERLELLDRLFQAIASVLDHSLRLFEQPSLSNTTHPMENGKEPPNELAQPHFRAVPTTRTTRSSKSWCV